MIAKVTKDIFSNIHCGSDMKCYEWKRIELKPVFSRLCDIFNRFPISNKKFPYEHIIYRILEISMTSIWFDYKIIKKKLQSLL